MNAWLPQACYEHFPELRLKLLFFLAKFDPVFLISYSYEKDLKQCLNFLYRNDNLDRFMVLCFVN